MLLALTFGSMETKFSRHRILCLIWAGYPSQWVSVSLLLPQKNKKNKKCLLALALELAGTDVCKNAWRGRENRAPALPRMQINGPHTLHNFVALVSSPSLAGLITTTTYGRHCHPCPAKGACIHYY